MRFAQPWILVLLAALPALGALLWAARRARRRRLARFASHALVPRLAVGDSTGRWVLGVLLKLAAIGLAIVALARPQWGRKDEPVVRRGVDVVFALDLSASMLAEDVSPNRLEQARAAAGSLLRTLEGDRVGLVVFGGRPATQCPLTLDYGAVRLFLDAAEADFAPGPGTDLGRAIEEASRLFKASERRYKAIVLFTDGEDLEGRGVEAARRAREDGIVIHAVGIGTPAGGPIPLRDDQGPLVGYKKDRQGRVVTTRYDPSSLEKLTLTTDGILLHAGPVGEEGRRIAEAIGGMEKREIASRLATRFEDRYQVPLALALALLAIESLLIGRGAKAQAPGAGAAAAAALWALVLAGLAIGPPAPASAQESAPAGADGGTAGGAAGNRAPGAGPAAPGNGSPAEAAPRSKEAGRAREAARPAPATGAPREERAAPASVARRNRDGNRLYEDRKYADALGRYEEASAAAPDLPSLRYNIGNTLFRQGKYDAAASEYSRALSGAGPRLAPAARYNLGNAEYAQEHYREAAEAYGKVLEQSPQDEEARRNLELALRMLKKQQEKQQQESQEQKGGQQQKQQNPQGGGQQDEKKEEQRGQQQQDGRDPRQDQDPGRKQEGQSPSDADRSRAKGQGSPTGEGKIGRKEAEKLLDSLAQEEKKDLKKRLARLPQDEGPEKDW